MTNGFAASVHHLTRDPSFAGRDLSSMRRGNLYPIMAPDVRPADPELRHNMLGMTEAGSVLLISGDDNDQPEHRRGSYGRPAPGFETRVIDTDRCRREASSAFAGRMSCSGTTAAAARSASTPTAGFTPAIWSAPIPTGCSTSWAGPDR